MDATIYCTLLTPLTRTSPSSCPQSTFITILQSPFRTPICQSPPSYCLGFTATGLVRKRRDLRHCPVHHPSSYAKQLTLHAYILEAHPHAEPMATWTTRGTRSTLRQAISRPHSSAAVTQTALGFMMTLFCMTLLSFHKPAFFNLRSQENKSRFFFLKV